MFEYDFINRYNSLFQPSTVHCRNTDLSMFFTKYLLQQAISRYQFILPELPGWDEAYFTYTLFCAGYGVVLKTARYGTIFQYGTLGGYNVNYMPDYVTVTNPALDQTYTRTIGKDCEVIKMQPLYGSIMDIIGYYADMMALTSEAIGVNIVNSKLAYLFAAGSRSAADTYKKLYDKVASGEPMVVADEKLYDKATGRIRMDYFTQDLKANYIANDLFESLKNIENKFFTDLGFNNANDQKKERMIVDEVNANNEATMSKCMLWLDTMKKSMDRANRMFGLSLDVKLRRIPQAEQGREEEPDEQ